MKRSAQPQRHDFSLQLRMSRDNAHQRPSSRIDVLRRSQSLAPTASGFRRRAEVGADRLEMADLAAVIAGSGFDLPVARIYRASARDVCTAALPAAPAIPCVGEWDPSLVLERPRQPVKQHTAFIIAGRRPRLAGDACRWGWPGDRRATQSGCPRTLPLGSRSWRL